jgi:Na+-driven multidrug efflux pump
MSAASDEQSPELADRRLALLVAALVGLEAVLLLVGAVVLLIDTFTSDRDNLGAASALAAVLVVLGVALAVCARGVIRGQRWTRGPVLTWQLLQAGVAMPLSTTRLWWVGVPLLAMAIVAGVLIAGRHVIPRPSGDRT